MTLTSLQFLAFFAIVLVVYFCIPCRAQYIYLLAASLVFYCLSATPKTIIYLAAGIVISYAGAILSDRLMEAGRESAAGMVTGAAVIANVLFLVMLKYLNLIIDTVNHIVPLFGIPHSFTNVSWTASLGLSFYTLSLIGYILDSRWGVIKPEKNILKFALFACYFPVMTSGPIVRFSDVKDQLCEAHTYDHDRVTHGLMRVLWGLFKKMIIAETLSVPVSAVFDNPAEYAGLDIWLAAFSFCLQLYTDFSGCMDIIMGVSECFGIFLPENFNVPFFSRTIQEFWRRWHITLGAWLRDYIMNPILKSGLCYSMKKFFVKRLGKKRGKKIHIYFAMFILWMAMGIWHGSSWKYALGEGLWFWLLIVAGQVAEPLTKRMTKALRINDKSVLWHFFQSARTFVCFSVGMIFFRADSIKSAFLMIKNSFVTGGGVTFFEDYDARMWIVLIAGFVLLVIADTFKYKGLQVRDFIAKQHIAVRWAAIYLMIIMVMIQYVYLSYLETGAFIYGQF